MNEDIGRETVFVPRGWRWEPFTIYQLRSHHPGWDGLRAVLDEGSIYQLVGDTSRPEDGIAVISKLHPEAILFGDDLPDFPAIELTTEFREVIPASKLVVVGEETEDELLMQPGEVGVDAVLPWQRVTPLGVLCCLMPVLQDGWKVGTGGAREKDDARRVRVSSADVIGATVQEEIVRAIENVLQPERRRNPRQETLVFTDLERAILTGVGRGLKVRQIAEQVALGERTVRRRIRELRTRFGAERLGQLAATAHELGFAKEEE